MSFVLIHLELVMYCDCFSQNATTKTKSKLGTLSVAVNADIEFCTRNELPDVSLPTSLGVDVYGKRCNSIIHL